MSEDTRSHGVDPQPRIESILGPRTLEILGVKDSTGIEIINPWYRGGAETYVSDFFLTTDGSRKHLIAKACIKFGPKAAMDEWLVRRQILSNNGVKFPELFAVDGATLVEEFIPFGFKEAYLLADEDTRKELRVNFIDIYKRVCGAGFAPTSLHDVRSHGNDIVLIDVGEDIGGYHPSSSSNLSIIYKAEEELRSLLY